MKGMAMVKKFWRDEDGGETVEYALVIGVIVIGLAGLMVLISGDVETLFQAISDELDEATP